MKKSHECEVATHIGPESCGASRKGGAEALIGSVHQSAGTSTSGPVKNRARLHSLIAGKKANSKPIKVADASLFRACSITWWFSIFHLFDLRARASLVKWLTYGAQGVVGAKGPPSTG